MFLDGVYVGEADSSAQFCRIKEGQSEDCFTQTLSKRFDDLVASMNRPGAIQATEAALFSDPASLNKTYRPGTTETDD